MPGKWENEGRATAKSRQTDDFIVVVLGGAQIKCYIQCHFEIISSADPNWTGERGMENGERDEARRV